MMSVYELKLSEDTLTAIKVTEELNKVEISGQDAVLFPNSSVNGFSWEGEDCESPQHFIVLGKGR